VHLLQAFPPYALTQTCHCRRVSTTRTNSTTTTRLALEGLELTKESSRGSRAALARTIEVLEGDEGSLDTGDLAVLRVVKREADSDAWVVDSVAGRSVSLEGIDVDILSRGAGAGNLDGFAVRAVHGTITVTGAGRVDTSGETERRNLRSESITSRCGRCSRGRCRSSRGSGWASGDLACLGGSEGSRESGSRRRAADTRTAEVLEGDELSLNTDDGSLGGVVAGELDTDTRVVDGMTSGHVGVERVDEIVPRWRAVARDVDVVDTLAVTIAIRSGTSHDTEVENLAGIHRATDGDRRDSRDEEGTHSSSGS